MAKKSLQQYLEEQPNIVPLAERSKGFLQVLLPEFTLTKESHGRLLEISVSEEMFSIVDLEGRRDLFEAVRRSSGSSRAELRKQLKDFEGNPRALSYHIDCSECHVRWANGGMLPVVRLDSKDYFCLFYRDIFPVGWNIANGASDNIEEILDPGRVVVREFGEELIICDPVGQAIYAFGPGERNRPPGYQREAFRAWTRIFGGPRPENYDVRLLPLKLIEGPDRVRVEMHGTSQSSTGYFLSVTPEDNAIEVDKLAIINLNVGGDLRLVDGESPDGQPLNRVIGLFEVAGFAERLKSKRFRPELHYFGGERREPRQLEDSITQYLAGLQKRKLGGRQRRRSYEQTKTKYDLCPITRSIIEKYFRWKRETPVPEDPRWQADVKEQIQDARNCEIFIAHKIEDHRISRNLYDYLMQKGHAVFISTETLMQLGVSDYADAINAALDNAKCLIVLGTRAEHFFSGWVKYEWSSFLNEILSGRKEDGELFPLVGDIEHRRLPYALRSRQIIHYSDTSPQNSFANLYSCVEPVLARFARK